LLNSVNNLVSEMLLFCRNMPDQRAVDAQTVLLGVEVELMFSEFDRLVSSNEQLSPKLFWNSRFQLSQLIVFSISLSRKSFLIFAGGWKNVFFFRAWSPQNGAKSKNLACSGHCYGDFGCRQGSINNPRVARPRRRR
jgi:hypothetical protein